jgi:hypothetical protein
MIFSIIVFTALIEGPKRKTFLVIAIAPPNESDLDIFDLI